MLSQFQRHVRLEHQLYILKKVASCQFVVRQLFELRRVWRCICVVFCLMPTLTMANDMLFGDKDIYLVTGEVKTISAANVNRVAVGDGKLLEVQIIDQREILLIGQTVGSTTLQLWTESGPAQRYRVTISDAKSEQDITMQKIVSMKVRIVEFKESSLKKIGIDWSKTSTGPNFFIAKDFILTPAAELIQNLSNLPLVGNTSNIPIFLGSSTALTSTLNFMQNTGHAATLAEPTLSCLSGKSASFLAGGEVPYATTNADGEATISFKPYGIKLDISPKADRHNRISTAISTEVSRIDMAVTVNGAPGFSTRKTNTHMNVVSGQTIIISGLLSEEANKDIEYIPGLANLPVIGQLFQTKNLNAEQTQLVIFVTPVIIDPENLSPHTVNAGHQNTVELPDNIHHLQKILDQGLADISIDIEG